MGYPNTTVPFPGYPMAVGAKNLSIVPHAGPASYTQVTTGPLAGGDVVQAAEFGLKWIERINAGMTSDGLYTVQAFNQTNGPVTSIILRWVVVSTGNQVAGAVNLSGSSVLLEAIGQP